LCESIAAIEEAHTMRIACFRSDVGKGRRARLRGGLQAAGSAIAALMLASLALPTMSRAADLYEPPPPLPPFDWNGWYLGLSGGYGWGDKDWTGTGGIGVPLPFTLSHDVDGWLGGAQIGANRQAGSLVYGFEGTFSWTGIDGGVIRDLGSGWTANATASVDWIATLVARLGVLPSERTLIYVTGGAALAEESFSAFRLPQPASGGGTDFSGVNAGWTVGAGVEWALTNHWSLKVEYNYLDFGSIHHAETSGLGVGPPVLPEEWDIDQKMHLVKAGVNYRF
jgi:outer membrane immunogenic protein